MKLRLDKYLADMGLGTRSEVKQAVRKGRVQVNGQTVREPEYKTETETDQVWFDGQPAAYREYEYYMLNKPAGVISASEDPRERCVVDLIESRKRKDLFPVGRLDKDTEGLLLITNDGGLAHRLLSPKKHVDNRRKKADPSRRAAHSERRGDLGDRADHPGGKISPGKAHVPRRRQGGTLSQTPADGPA